jgi:hypothetical protein
MANTVVVVDILVWFVRAFDVHSFCVVVGIKGESFFRLRGI